MWHGELEDVEFVVLKCDIVIKYSNFSKLWLDFIYEYFSRFTWQSFGSGGP